MILIQALRPSPGVAHQDAAQKGEHHKAYVDGTSFDRQKIGDGREHDAFRHPVERRIEERSEGGDLLRQPGQRPVEHVETPGHQEDDARVDQVIGYDQGRRRHVEHRSGDCDLVRGYPKPSQRRDERHETPAQLGPEKLANILHYLLLFGFREVCPGKWRL